MKTLLVISFICILVGSLIIFRIISSRRKLAGGIKPGIHPPHAQPKFRIVSKEGKQLIVHTQDSILRARFFHSN